MINRRIKTIGNVLLVVAVIVIVLIISATSLNAKKIEDNDKFVEEQKEDEICQNVESENACSTGALVVIKPAFGEIVGADKACKKVSNEIIQIKETLPNVDEQEQPMIEKSWNNYEEHIEKLETIVNETTEIVCEPDEPDDDTDETEEKVDEAEETIDEPTAESTGALYTASQFKRLGVIWYNGWRFTWYSERVLPGGGLTIPGRHNDENGYICDENDYICVASSVLSKGTVVDTPFGKSGKVYDCGCNADTIDVYVGW